MEKKLRKEAIYLYIVLFANFLLPLITIPYLTSHLGLSAFGLLGYAQTCFAIFTFFIEFGFVLTGARSISINSDNNKMIATIYSNIQIIKFLVFCLLLFVTGLLLLFVDIPVIDKKIIIISIVCSASAILIPTFLFNGMSKNSVLALVTVICRVLFLLPIFYFVKSPADVLIAVFLQLFPTFLVGIIVQIIIHKRKYAKFSLSYFDKIVCIVETRRAYDNFVASFFTLGFTYLTPILVKYILGNESLGLYTIVDKLINVLRQLYNPLSQTFFSKISLLYEQCKYREYLILLKKISALFLLVGFSAFVGNILLGDILLPIFLGIDQNLQNILSIAIFTQIVVSIAMISINFIIIPSDNSSILKKIYFLASLCYIPLCIFFINYFGLKGVFFAILCLEIFITIYLINYCYKKILVKENFLK